MKKIAIYGKGGIGKSTISSNISAALSHMGEKVMQVGCDPKRDSIFTLCGRLMPTVLDTLRKEGSITEKNIETVIHKGYNSILGVECGGPKPGVGCGGAGVMTALNILSNHKVMEKYGITFAIFDVLGDVVCGGFGQPMRAGYAREVYLIANGEFLSLYQTNNIAKAIRRVHDQGADCACAGIIDNMRGVPNEDKIVEKFASKIGLPVIAHIPRSKIVQEAELQTKTVIELFPNSEMAETYRRLAVKIRDNSEIHVPNPIKTTEEITNIVEEYTIIEAV